MASFLVKFGTVDLSAEVETWDERLDSRTNIQEIPRRHGGFIADVPTLMVRVITLRGGIIGSSIDVARARLDVILKELNNGIQKLFLFSDKFVMAQKRSFRKELSVGSVGGHYRFECELECADPFLYADTLVTVNTTADLVTPPGVTAFTLTNNGDAFVYPRITFTANIAGAITSLTLKNLTSVGQKKFTFSGTVANTKSLVVNPIDLTVKNDGTLDLTNSTGEIFLPLLSGANSMEYNGSDCTIKTEWRERWFS